VCTGILQIQPMWIFCCPYLIHAFFESAETRWINYIYDLPGTWKFGARSCWRRRTAASFGMVIDVGLFNIYDKQP
jgi:hypothetical protein